MSNVTGVMTLDQLAALVREDAIDTRPERPSSTLPGSSRGHGGDSGNTRYGMSTWMHEGKQYVIIQLADGLAAMALP